VRQRISLHDRRPRFRRRPRPSGPAARTPVRGWQHRPRPFGFGR
jgi:hypothetical protein